MAVMTIRGIDSETTKILKKKAVDEGLSVNSLIIKIINELLGLAKKKRGKKSIAILIIWPAHGRTVIMKSLWRESPILTE